MRFSACPSLRAAILRLARGYLASKLNSGTDLSNGCRQSVGERLETSPRKRPHEVCHIEMAMGGRILARRRHDLGGPPRLRGHQVRHRSKAFRLAGHQIEHARGTPQGSLENEVDSVIHIEMIPRFLTIAEQRDAPVYERLADESIGS